MSGRTEASRDEAAMDAALTEIQTQRGLSSAARVVFAFGRSSDAASLLAKEAADYGESLIAGAAVELDRAGLLEPATATALGSALRAIRPTCLDRSAWGPNVVSLFQHASKVSARRRA